MNWWGGFFPPHLFLFRDHGEQVKIMRYCIIRKPENTLSAKWAAEITSVLKKDPTFIRDDVSPEVIVTIGGDGTFLSAVQDVVVKGLSAPLFCFNTGRIGYYNDFTEDDIPHLRELLLSKSLKTKEFPLLEAHSGKDTFYAINEFVLTGLSKNIAYSLMLDGKKLENFFGIGLLFSTPSGSMAYNRSIQGAILDSTLPCFQLAEIAGIQSKAYHSLNNPLVLSATRTVELAAETGKEGGLYADGLVKAAVAPHLSIQFSQKTIRCYVRSDETFLRRMQKTIE